MMRDIDLDLKYCILEGNLKIDALEEEGLKKILPYFTFDGAPLKGYYNSEP